MRLCPACGEAYDGSGWHCPHCAFEPVLIDGFPAMAPELATAGQGYDPALFGELARLEGEHFWFRTRNRLICWSIRTYFADARDFLEVGCGTGYVLSGIAAAFPALRLAATELHVAGLREARNRVPQAELIQADARRLPYTADYSLVGCFDVLEHIDEDQQVLEQLERSLRPGGGLILTVPQHPWLWSRRDDHACHVRRYRRDELVQKVSAAGFEILRTTSFVSLLLPLMILSRWRKAVANEADPLAELRLGRASNRVLEGISMAEFALLRAGFDFPAGGSLLLIARRPAR